MIVRRAFTLLELLVVTALLGVACAIVFVSVAGATEKEQLDGLLRRIADGYGAARAGAICQGQTCSIRYDLRQNRITLATPGAPDTEPVEIALPGACQLVAVTPAETDDCVTVTVGPTGVGRSHTVAVRWKNQWRGTVAINGFTGHSEIASSAVE